MIFRQIFKDNKTLMYKLKYKDSTSTINAKVDKQNEILVSAPRVLTLDQIDQFILKNFDKFYKFIKSVEENTLINLKENFIFLEGKKYNIKIYLIKGREKYEILSNNLHLFLRDEENKKKMIEKVMNDIGRTKLINRTKLYSKKLNIIPSEITTKWCESKWGQCNINERKITLAIQLIMFNEEIIDYVIIHELCHLIHANHSSDFWNLVGQYYPNYKWAREKLKFQC